MLLIIVVVKMGDDSKDVKVGDLIALMVAEGEDWTDVQVPGKKKTTSPVAKEAVQEHKVEQKDLKTSDSVTRHS